MGVKFNNIDGKKHRAIHRTMRRKGQTTLSLRAFTRSMAKRVDGDGDPSSWEAAEAAAFMRRKGMRA